MMPIKNGQFHTIKKHDQINEVHTKYMKYMTSTFQQV